MKKKRYLYEQSESHNFLAQALLETRTLRSYQLMSNLKMVSTGSKVSVKNHCCLTNSFGSMFSDYKLSRLKFSSLALYGYLSGVQKASW